MKTSGFMHSMNASETPKLLPLPVILLICALTIVLCGVGGYMLVKKAPAAMNGSSNGATVQTDKSAGVVDKKTFKDSAEGILKEGGMDGEGNFHLERPGGVSQNAYLTSSTVDLSKYIGKKIKVWGQTFSGQKAGWLMDVGLVEIQ
jgi:hypothetical protein